MSNLAHNLTHTLESTADVTRISWPEPKPLESRLPTVESFDLEMLPHVLRAWAVDIQELMQVAIDIVAVCLIVLLASATNRRARIQPKAIDSSWQQPLNLWGSIISPPGDKKTSTMQRIFRPLHLVQDQWRVEDQQKLAEYLQDVQQAKKDKKPEPAKPNIRSLIVNDATGEALHEAMRDNPPGLSSIQDELTRWLGDLQKAGREGERGFYLASWNGNTPHQLKRIGRGTIDVPHACLSMLGGIQPKPLASYLSGESGGAPLGDDGLLQRFQVSVWPDRYTGYQYVDRLPSKGAEARVAQLVRMLTNLDANKPMLMKFSREAQQLFVEWFVQLETRLATEDLNPLLVQYLAKYRSLMPILAALFELADWGEEIAPSPRSLIRTGFVGFVGCRPVARVNAERAIKWCHYLESHARRICSLTRTDQHVTIALAAKIRSGELRDGFTVRLIVQKGWRFLSSTELLKRACQELCAAGWIREVVKQPGIEGGRPSVSYQVNPRVKTLTDNGDLV
jgi:putative DNA primase/helicase